MRQRKANEMGISHEEGFLEEEEQLKMTITDLDQELRVTRQAFEALTIEKDKADAHMAEMNLQLEQLVALKKQLKIEVKDLKMRETQTMADYAELEDENVSLQKQLMQVKQAQVEFESIKHENRRLHEELDELKGDVEGLNRVKEIVEQNLEETLEILHHEREEKHNLKKELDSRITSESMLALQTLASLGLSDFKPNHSEGNKSHFESLHEDHDSPMLRKIEADFFTPNKELLKAEPAPAQGLVGDLFSEIHVSEIRKLEQMVEQLEMEKGLLERSLEESNANLESSRQAVSEQTEKVQALKMELDLMVSGAGDVTDSGNDLSDIVRQYPTYRNAIKEIANLNQEVTKLQNLLNERTREEDASALNVEGANRNYEETIRRLETELADRSDRVSEIENNLSWTQENLMKMTKDICQMYSIVCEASGETPVKSMIEHLRHHSGKNPIRSADAPKDAETEKVELVHDAGTCSEKDGITSQETADNFASLSCYKLFELIFDQMKHLNHAVERMANISRQNRSGDVTSGEEVSELQEQVVKLRAMLATKREQISTLRTVLKQNKATAETAMTHLKQHYDKEKAEINESTTKLRNELMRLKEDAATFAALRAAFAQRCDEYTTQLDELQRQLSAAEAEKKTLNSLLRMALQQKLALTSKLEDLENDRERKSMRPQRPTRGRGNRSGGYNSPHQAPDEGYYRYSPQLRFQRRDY